MMDTLLPFIEGTKISKQEENWSKDDRLNIVGFQSPPCPNLSIIPGKEYEFLDKAIPQKQALVDEYTFYIHDLSSLVDEEYNTIIFKTNDYPIKTKETTTQVMKRYFTYQGLSYEEVKLIGKSQKIEQKCPYVLGKTYYVPDKGPSKNHPSWIAMHHVKHIESIGKETTLNILNCSHELTVQLSQSQMDLLRLHCKLLSITQLKLRNYLMDLFPVNTDPNKPLDVIDKLDTLVQTESLHPIEYLNRLNKEFARNSFKEAFGEGDEYLQEILDAMEDNFNK